MKPKIVVIGNSYTTRLGIIRSVAQVECDIIVIVIGHYGNSLHNIKTTKPIDCYSKYVNKVLYYSEEAGKEGLVKLILDECVDESQKAIIIPSSDFSASAIDNYQSSLKDYFLFPHIQLKEGAVSSWMNKMVQKEKAIEIGLNVPKAVVVEIKDHQYNIPQSIEYPCFTKPMTSLDGGKNCVRRCDNRRDLQSVLDIAVAYGISNILVEDYINIEKEYAILGFSDGKNVVVPGLINFIKGSQTYPGIALMGKVQSVQGYEELIDKFALYIKKIGYIGIFDIDFFEAGGKYYFGELNLRIGGSAYAITKMGVNLPLMFIRAMQGESIDGIPRQIQGNSVFVNERLCFLDWYRFKLSTKEYRKYIHAAEISFIIAENDPNPQKVYNRRYIIMYIKRIIKSLFHLN